MQQMRLNASTMLLRSIQINELIRDSEAESGQVANSSEDAEVEDDDGCWTLESNAAVEPSPLLFLARAIFKFPNYLLMRTLSPSDDCCLAQV